MNVVTLRQTQLVPGWVTVLGRVNHLGPEPGTQVDSAGIVIQWYVAPYTDNTEWYVALMLAAGVWGGVGGA